MSTATNGSTEKGILITSLENFAVYCDNIATGSNCLDELLLMFEELVSALKRANIQVKVSEVKFGVKGITFHNHRISAEGMRPKDENLNPIRNMAIPRDVSHVRAYLGCCQQLAKYVKHYSIIAAPLHNLARKNIVFPNPWLEGTDYDVSFHRL